MKSIPVASTPELVAEPGQLNQLTFWAQRLLAEVIHPGARLVDLTAGNGHDSLFMARCLGRSGQLLSFDIQPPAIRATSTRLTEHGFSFQHIEAAALLTDPGCYLIFDGHQNINSYLCGDIDAAIGNLGYLPGGDKQLITRTETTLAALRALLPHLSVGGRLALILYPGHTGGSQESAAVDTELSALATAQFDVLRLQVCNRRNAPYLMLIERRCS